MIDVCDDCEYTVSMANLIETLAKLDSFTIQLWINNIEIPLKFTQDDDFLFLQESIRIENDLGVAYVLYDMITHMEVIK